MLCANKFQAETVLPSLSCPFDASSHIHCLFLNMFESDSTRIAVPFVRFVAVKHWGFALCCATSSMRSRRPSFFVLGELVDALFADIFADVLSLGVRPPWPLINY